MKKRRSIAATVNAVILILAGILCLFPLVHICALSLSSTEAVSLGLVSLWPVKFTTASYQYILDAKEFWRAFLISFERIILGVPLSLFICVLTAYPLSKKNAVFRSRTFWSWFVFIPMLFSGGIIPFFIVMSGLNMLGKIWALVIPAAVNSTFILLLLNFFRALPIEIEESVVIDGANPYTILFRIVVPLSLPSIATIAVYSILGHWNAWFDGLILMNSPTQYPMMTYLQYATLNTNMTNLSTDEVIILSKISNRTYKAAQVFVATIPMLATYPFFQRYFTKGLVLGAVKG